jgi:hypothetical protein
MLSLYENVEDRLISKALRIPALQSVSNSLLSQPSCEIDFSAASKLIRAAKDLDGELADWAKRIPAKWSYTTILRMRASSDPELSSTIFLPNQIHRYPDFYTARVWNLYRVYRMIIQSILYRVSSLYSTDHDQDSKRIQKINTMMVDDICASVPFLLGYDLADLKGLHSLDNLHLHFPDKIYLWPQSSMKGCISGGPARKFSLIWPLYIACSVAAIPATQRKWMRAQLKWIAETGETHAQIIMETESQTLFGGPESFRFDCA